MRAIPCHMIGPNITGTIIDDIFGLEPMFYYRPPPTAALPLSTDASSCKLPEQPEDGSYISKATECITNPGTPACRNINGTIVPSNWLIKYTCDYGYSLSQDSHYSICENGKWQNQIVCISKL